MFLEFLKDADVFSWQIISILIFAGFCIGVINTLAGSGSIIAYSLFMLLGLPSNVANGTFRLGVIMQTFAASISFHKQKILELRKALILSIPVVIGSLIGAKMATTISEDIFETIVGSVMLLMLFFMFYKPETWIKGNKTKQNKKITFKQLFIFFCIGIYGGFVHIGVGIFLLSALVLEAGYDLVKANAIKILIVFIYSPIALTIFILDDKVAYSIGLIAAIGNTIGGIVASNFAITWGTKFIRWFLIIVIILFTAKLFGLFNYL